jgi:selenocysteine-specific elongation factor
VWDLLPAEIDALVAARAVTRHGTDLVSDALWRTWQRQLVEECSQRHAASRTLQGLRENDFDTDVPERFRGDVLAGLVSAGVLQQRAGRFRPARHQVELSPAERQLLERLTLLLDVAQPPSLGDIGKTLRIPLTKLQAEARTLASKGALVQVNDKRVYLPERLAALAATAEALSADGEFTARAYRDAAGIGRNVAIDVLEYFDARGFTRRLNDLRRVVGERSRAIPGPQ